MAAAQAITELSFLLVGSEDSQQNYLSTVLIHLDRIYDYDFHINDDIKILAMSIQSIIHLLAIGGVSLPLFSCCKSGKPISPPLGNNKWSCYYIPHEGFSMINSPESFLNLNPSEIALLQRLLYPELPIKSNGELLGPRKVWLKLLSIIESWIPAHLGKELSSLKILKTCY